MVCTSLYAGGSLNQYVDTSPLYLFSPKCNLKGGVGILASETPALLDRFVCLQPMTAHTPLIHTFIIEDAHRKKYVPWLSHIEVVVLLKRVNKLD